VLGTPGLGLVGALQVGLAACRAPFIARMDADDEAAPERLELSLAALADGARTAHQVAHRLPWTRHDHVYDALDPFAQGMASMETKAHLELLVARGAATRQETPDGVLFAAAGGP
jgi:glycosyltransferase involved in cell wall biosynthesis